MDEDEIWVFVTNAHTGILTTLEADGSPVSLPLSFAVQAVYAQSALVKFVVDGKIFNWNNAKLGPG
jgi:hypothetical protein